MKAGILFIPQHTSSFQSPPLVKKETVCIEGKKKKKKPSSQCILLSALQRQTNEIEQKQKRRKLRKLRKLAVPLL